MTALCRLATRSEFPFLGFEASLDLALGGPIRYYAAQAVYQWLAKGQGRSPDGNFINQWPFYQGPNGHFIKASPV